MRSLAQSDRALRLGRKGRRFNLQLRLDGSVTQWLECSFDKGKTEVQIFPGLLKFDSLYEIGKRGRFKIFS